MACNKVNPIAKKNRNKRGMKPDSNFNQFLVSTAECDRCGRSLSGKGYIENLGMYICGVCDYEIKILNQEK